MPLNRRRVPKARPLGGGKSHPHSFRYRFEMLREKPLE